MRLPRVVGPATLIAGIAVLALAVARGEASLYLVVIVPVIAGTGPLAFLGILLVFAGFFLSFLTLPARVAERSLSPEEIPPAGPPELAPARRWGGVVFLGPLPLVFGSDPKMARTMLLLGALLFVALLALTLIALFA